MDSDTRNAVLMDEELLQKPLCSLFSLASKIFFVGMTNTFSRIFPISEVTVILLLLSGDCGEFLLLNTRVITPVFRQGGRTQSFTIFLISSAITQGSIAPVCHGTPRGFYQKIAYACDCSGIFSKWKRGVAPQITYISSFDHVSSAINSCQLE